MKPEDVLEFARNRPFQPFRITLSEGREYVVSHPEFAMVGATTVAIGIPKHDYLQPIYDRLITVSLSHIMQIELLDSASAE